MAIEESQLDMSLKLWLSALDFVSRIQSFLQSCESKYEMESLGLKLV